MIRRSVAILVIFGALAIPSAVGSQAIPGKTEHTTCPREIRPASFWTFHGGYAWDVTYHTFPYQFGFAQYSALPSPATSDNGRATWTNPGAYVECTLTWYHNPDGSVAYVDFRWHIISYRGSITVNPGDGCGGRGDPVYMESYDPYAPDPMADGMTGQNYCDDDDGGGGGGGDGGGDGGGGGCTWEWMEIEISYDGGQTWHLWWSGYGRVCQEIT